VAIVADVVPYPVTEAYMPDASVTGLAATGEVVNECIKGDIQLVVLELATEAHSVIVTSNVDRQL
jgi:hypothetical protein